MKYILYFSMLLTALLAAGCAKVETEGFTPEVKKYEVILSADCNTRTSLAFEEDGVRKVLWKDGDLLGLFVQEDGVDMSSAQNIIARLASGTESGPGYSQGSFTTSIELTESKVYNLGIYYPYIATAGSASEISHKIPAIQTQAKSDASRHLGESGAFAYATAIFSTPSDLQYYDTPVVDFTLSHKTSTMNLSVKAGDEAMAGWKVKSVSVKAPEGCNLAGDVIYTPETDVFAISGDGSEKVTLNIPGGAALSVDTATDLYLVTFPAALSGKSLEITYTLEASDASALKTVTHTRILKETSNAFKASTVHKFEESIPSADAEGWVYSIATSFDLSANGTANCYVVSTPGTYSFDATVIGNGQEGILLPVETTFFHSESAVISPAAAALVWQTGNGLIRSVSYSDGRITFEKSADVGYGNAVIAATDTDGNVIWSWHIWCTDLGELQTYVSATGTYEGMDRNLGATYASKAVVTDSLLLKRAVGTFYQWGRKDPFIGPKVFDASRSSKVYDDMYDIDGNVVTRPTAPAASTQAGQSIQYTIANPLTPIYTGGSTNGDWFALTTKSGSGPENRGYYLWGNPVGYEYASANRPTPVKTIYDPCPPGYMVPPMDFYSGMSLVSNVAYLGMVMKISSSSDTSWFPLASAMSSKSSSTAWVGDGIGYMWTSSYGSATGTSARSIRMGYTGFNSLNNGYGFQLRCVQEIN